MRIYDLNTMTKGWFVGSFTPSVVDTDNVEVAVKKYKEGDYEEKHYHKIAKEITVVVQGKVKMCGQVFSENDIIFLEPGEATDFTALKDSVCVVVKIPGAKNDKYIIGEDENA